MIGRCPVLLCTIYINDQFDTFYICTVKFLTFSIPAAVAVSLAARRRADMISLVTDHAQGLVWETRHII